MDGMMAAGLTVQNVIRREGASLRSGKPPEFGA